MKSYSFHGFLFGACILPLLGGCAAFKSPAGPLLSNLLGGKAEAVVDAEAVPASQKVVVEFNREKGLAGRVRVPVKPGMVIQDVLEGSGATDRFSRMTIKLKRRVDGSQGYLPITAVYDQGRNAVRPESNYAIRPGDFLVITEDTATSTDDMVQQLFGPLGL